MCIGDYHFRPGGGSCIFTIYEVRSLSRLQDMFVDWPEEINNASAIGSGEEGFTNTSLHYADPGDKKMMRRDWLVSSGATRHWCTSVGRARRFMVIHGHVLGNLAQEHGTELEMRSCCG